MLKIPQNNLLHNSKWLKMGMVGLGLLVVAVIAFSSWANRGSGIGPSAEPAAVSGGDLAIKVLVSLIIISALIYITVYGLRVIYRKKNSTGAILSKKSRIIHVLETVDLDAGHKLHVVKIGDKNLMIGVSEHQVNLIAELDAETCNCISEQDSRASDTGKQESFRSIIINHFNQIKGKKC
ncbi:MAG: flagellar biosynthetic protein FliO [Actinomycetota bacterium]|jgi:flagellar biogenesis protein FliO|nr:flagellar biosynthetic protein FliO [Actinomycetota bacterium]